MIELNQENLCEFISQSKEPVLLEFGAEWCQPCKRLDPELVKLAEKWVGKIQFGYINVDHSPDIAAQYMVMGVPTLILIKDGEAVERITGFRPVQSLIEIFGGFVN
ncbi:MAG: thioredoxin family protein [Anaerolineaceae bacterium]|nr:MAG: thioredoxin [Chloroflexi bacterium HGW-Chloroflexi-8]